jgi:hypothetical protein
MEGYQKSHRMLKGQVWMDVAHNTFAELREVVDMSICSFCVSSAAHVNTV